MNDRRFGALPLYLMLITANALPVYGAFVGKLVFFQVIYLFWFESLLLIFFDCVRIATARGKTVDGFIKSMLTGALIAHEHASIGFGPRLAMILRTVLIRVAILLFYLVFIIVFIGLQLTNKHHTVDVATTLALSNPFFNTAVCVFLINMTVQLIGGFFLSGRYRIMSPRNYAGFFDGRTILMHVMIVGSVFIHQFFFEHKSYETLGEAVYVGIFMLIRTVMDIVRIRSHFEEDEAQAPVMI